MPRGYVKKQRPNSYYTEKGSHNLQKAIRYLEQVPDMQGSQSLSDLKTLSALIAEVHTLTLLREQGVDISGFTIQTKLETPDLEILKET